MTEQTPEILLGSPNTPLPTLPGEGTQAVNKHLSRGRCPITLPTYWTQRLGHGGENQLLRRALENSQFLHKSCVHLISVKPVMQIF
jgi:hypothetical protein